MPRQQLDPAKLEALIANDEKCRKECREAREARDGIRNSLGPAETRLLKAQRELDASEEERRKFLAGG